MQTVDISRSPVQALASTIRGGLQAGQVGAVFARAGTGKSAFVVQVAIDALLRGSNVLHVSLDHPQAHVRTYYDELLHELTEGVDRTTHLGIDRHRVVRSCLGRSFGPADLGSLLDTLERVMDFRPVLVIVDGLEVGSLDALAWAGVASEANVRLWLSVRTHRDHGPNAVALAGEFTAAIALEPAAGSVNVHILRQSGKDVTESPAISIDPNTLLLQQVLGEKSGARTTLAPEACTLYATGADGAEGAFGALAEQYGMAEVNFTTDGHDPIRSRGRSPLSDRELAAGDVSLKYVSRRLNRQWDGDENVRRVLQLLWQVVSHADQVFVVGSIREDGTVVGGTGWSVELARRWHKEVWVFDQANNGWHTWDGKQWIAGTPSIRATRIAGTGTRHLSEEGRAAIEALFSRSFDS